MRWRSLARQAILCGTGSRPWATDSFPTFAPEFPNPRHLHTRWQCSSWCSNMPLQPSSRDLPGTGWCARQRTSTRQLRDLKKWKVGGS